MIPESERLKEDTEFVEQTRKAKPKGKQVFLQKFHHKGAFYADSDIHKKHDYTAPTEGTLTKMELLPAVMQVRDFGKMSRTKWTHLVKEPEFCFFLPNRQIRTRRCAMQDGVRRTPAGLIKLKRDASHAESEVT
ncbi:hypothetical protein PtB15_18B2 [Puccinia triticina]|nr:hypothetical protein PtB15_18B2 [Puccinia triticina]